MPDTKQLWENVLVDIELNISKANFTTWFKDTHIVSFEDGIVYLGVPNQFVKDWLSTKYHKFILKTLRAHAGEARGVEYVISTNKKQAERSARQSLEQRGSHISGDSNSELPLSDSYISKYDNLNPRYTFENFVVGQFNELAYAAAQAVIQKPGLSYNPLFVHGPTGHGKTHLIQAIGNYIKHTGASKSIYYVTSEKFTIDYVNALQNTKINNFKEKYRGYDVLIMDDIQFLSKKEKTQEELFHLFNALYDNNKQIIFSSDKHPSYIPYLEDRLKSRFSAGMIVDIPTPDHESRVAILKTKAGQHNYALSDAVVDYIASHTEEGNIRELEGILNLLICQAHVRSQDITVADAQNILQSNQTPKRSMSIEEVVQAIAQYYRIDEQSIYDKTRRKEVVKPRQLLMYLLREDFNVSYPLIGERLGGRDHTTVIHSCEKVKESLKSDMTLSQEVDQIRSMLK